VAEEGEGRGRGRRRGGAASALSNPLDEGWSGPVAIVGTGLIGGSLGLALRAARPRLSVTGFDAAPAQAHGARARGAVTGLASSTAEATAGAKVVFLCMPVDQIPAALGEVATAAGPGTIVTDVGSAKEAVVGAGEAALGSLFVGGHPMAGSERHGIEAADPGLFDDAPWVLTPTATTSSRAYRVVAEIVGWTGARPVAVDPVVHDGLVARLSHVPQVAASALVDVAVGAGERDGLTTLAGRGFRDVTRIAASNPELWVAIMRANQKAVLEGLDQLGRRLDQVARLVAEERWSELEGWFAAARSARLEAFAKPVVRGIPVTLSLMIPDRPGVLAEVTTAAGELGANIEDLRIDHSTEGGRGRLELVVSGRAAADRLAPRLTELGYHVERVAE
jgi:prephenate dehydrogenase